MGLSGTGELVPVLAERYEMSDDGKSYTFILRKGAVFTDGTPVTSDDVVFTVKKAQDPALKSPEYANWSGVGVTAIDQSTVRFTISKPYAPFLGLTTLGILPAHLWQKLSDAEFPFSTLQTSPIGNGPFKVANLSRNASGLIERVTLVANTKYVLGRPYLNSIRFNFYANNEDIVMGLKKGGIDTAYGIPSSTVVTAPYARVFGIFFNPSEKQVFSRNEVRKALSMVIQRDTIVSNVLGGYATPIMGPVPHGNTSIQQAPLPKFEDPLSSAVKILETAGWKYDSDSRGWKYVKDKQTLDTITIRTPNVPELKNVASAVKDDWERLGVAVDIELYEPGDLSQNVIRPRKYQALLYGMVIGRDQDLYAFWDSQEQNDPGLNIALYANKTIDALLEDARGNVSSEARKKDLQKIEDIISGEYPAAFLYSPDFIYAIPADLHGVALPQIITPSDRFATVASWYRITDAVWPFFVRKQ
jgi:peptide/nickel transport system substrate-binding protein